MNCRFCGKQFNRGFNLRRHESDNCSSRYQDGQEMTQEHSWGDEMHYSTEEDDLSISSESMATTDNGSEPEEEEDPWVPIINEAEERTQSEFEDIKEHLINTGLDEETAEKEAISNILPKLQKTLEDIYIERLSWIQEMERDPVHKKIMQTKKEFMENDNFDPREALEAAIDKRKFLIKKHLKGYDIFDDEENDE